MIKSILVAVTLSAFMSCKKCVCNFERTYTYKTGDVYKEISEEAISCEEAISKYTEQKFGTNSHNVIVSRHVEICK